VRPRAAKPKAAKGQRISPSQKASASGLDQSIYDADEPPPVSGDNNSDSNEEDDDDDDNLDMFEDVLAIKEMKNGAPRKKGIYHDSYRIASGINGQLKPIAEISDMFGDMIGKALKTNQPIGLEACAKRMANRPIRIGTMCSGTESPLLSADLIRSGINSHQCSQTFINPSQKCKRPTLSSTLYLSTCSVLKLSLTSSITFKPILNRLFYSLISLN
jgi:hypothetical protein